MQIAMLGSFEVRTDDGSLADVPGARLRGLLIALALNPGQLVPKGTLIDWIWGEQPPSDSSNALQRLVSRLRKVLPDGSIEGLTDGYRLRIEPEDVDAVRFERLVSASQVRDDDDPRRANLLREALGLWRGAAMQDVGLSDSSAFDAVITRLDGLRLSAQEDRFDAEVGLGNGAQLITELTDLVAAHPLRERLAAALMRALVAAGRDNEALQVYQRTRESLADELGVDPSADLAALHVALLRGELAKPEKKENRKTNLRAELTSFVGKDADVAAVRDLIAEHRLTTLIGPGGSGKTRLATETARTLLGGLPDGAWLVELASIGPDGDVAQATLAGLGLRDTLLGDVPNAELTDRLIAAIRDRDALLILDNCEHVIESAATFAHRVLGECQRLRILATSREPLGITGEALWQVEPLELPQRYASRAEMESSPAVQLLRDRAGAVRKDIVIDTAVDTRTLGTMVRVCRALDGMPLAIELAAARLRTMSIDQLANRLDDVFRLLTGGSRTALPRHKTLRAVVDWSWELLTDAERMVLRRFAVFLGGASLEAAERVCAGDAVEQDEVLELLTSLAEKSLLLTEGEGLPRFRMLGTIREYAGQKLDEAGEADLARQAHLGYFAELAETAEPHLRRGEQLTWLEKLDAEQDNLASAMRAALAARDAAGAMRLAAGVGWYWWLSGHKAEGMELMTAATELPGEVSDDIQATVSALMVMYLNSGRADEHQSAHWINRAYEFIQRGQTSYPLLSLVIPMQRMLTAPDAFLPAFESLLDDADPWVRALSRLQLGKLRIILGQDERDAAGYLAQSLAEFRDLGERFGMSFALNELAQLDTVRGDFAGACEYYEQAIVAVIELGGMEDAIRIRSAQAKLYWLLGDKDASAAAIADAQRYSERVTWPADLAELALAKAELARWDGDHESSYRQLQLARTMFGETAELLNVRATIHDLLGYLAEDLDDARGHRVQACEAAAGAGYAPLIAQVLVGVADLALRRGQNEQAARLLAASTAVRGLPDRSQPDAARIEDAARGRIGDDAFNEAAEEGAHAAWSELVEPTLAP
ncbi:MAG TPA: BTAD domain-containing putative transcriptional regulator [Pseudonocardiaceae bacterium]|nr:BTAD domain-containing putative transcriptional regulator [Pseudonocardiaceae bacterium]